MTSFDAPSTDVRIWPRCLIIVPCLNEGYHIGDLLECLAPAAGKLAAKIVVADGGSTDGTREIVATKSRTCPSIVLLHNPRRLQSAAVNLAVERYGADTDYLIRIDAHGGYDPDYCTTLVQEALDTGADSVVVAMQTVSHGGKFQNAAAQAQNSRLGTGGAKHRIRGAGQWTDHGHHALMRTMAFRAIGGYDEVFSHNEDAELDFRLVRAGFRIWMTDRASMVYFPRKTAGSLFKQYLGYGRGRARNLLKHRMMPKPRQMVPIPVAPALLIAPLGIFAGIAVFPLLLWAAACMAVGVGEHLIMRKRPSARVIIAAMIMHLAWSTGFWLQLLGVNAKPAMAQQGAAP